MSEAIELSQNELVKPDDIAQLFFSAGAGSSLSALALGLPATLLIENRMLSGGLLIAAGIGTAWLTSRAETRKWVYFGAGATGFFAGSGVLQLSSGISEAIFS